MAGSYSGFNKVCSTSQEMLIQGSKLSFLMHVTWLHDSCHHYRHYQVSVKSILFCQESSIFDSWYW
eukprot:c9911_g2_i1 orf=72-269(+)